MTIKVAFPFVGDNIGGSHVSAALLMRHLPKHGFAATALVHRHGQLSAWLGERGLAVVETDLPDLTAGTGGVSAVVRLAAIAPSLAWFLRRNDFRLLHSNDGRTTSTWMPAARLAGIRGVAHQRTRWSISQLAYRTTRMADVLIAISDFVRDSMPAELRSRATLIANPFSFDAPLRQVGRKTLEELTGKTAPTVAFVGTLQAQKRPDIFLRAAALIHRVRADVRFVVIGREGELGGQMRQLRSELGLVDAVAFTGFRPDALELLAGCDLLLAPAVNEGQGRAVIEAMTCSVPVVAARSGGHPSIIQSGSTGLLVPPDDAPALAEAAIGLLDRPEMGVALARAALAWVRSTFSAEVHARNVASQYRTLLPG